MAQSKTTTDLFPITQDCRQGSCCSPMPFILCVEVQGIAIVNISGDMVDDIEVKIEQFANDYTFTLDGPISITLIPRLRAAPLARQ